MWRESTANYNTSSRFVMQLGQANMHQRARHHAVYIYTAYNIYIFAHQTNVCVRSRRFIMMQPPAAAPLDPHSIASWPGCAFSQRCETFAAFAYFREKVIGLLFINSILSVNFHTKNRTKMYNLLFS